MNSEEGHRQDYLGSSENEGELGTLVRNACIAVVLAIAAGIALAVWIKTR